MADFDPGGFAVSRDDDGRVFVVPSVELDLSTAPTLREVLHGLMAEGHGQLQVDLRAVRFLDSTAVAVLIGAHRRMREAGGALVLSNADPRVRRVLDTLGLAEHFGL